jgi:trehalose 6-phosphate phosphatase
MRATLWCSSFDGVWQTERGRGPMTARNRTLPSPATASLFLDFDGTLVDIAERPDLVVVTDRVTGFLARALEVLEGRLAIVSGRSVDDLMGFLPVEGMVMVGGHGAEHRDARGNRQMNSAWRDAAAVMAARAEAAASERLMIERKPTGIALHFRAAPEAEPEAQELARRIVADFAEFDLQDGHCVVELRPKAASKRGAVRGLLEQAPYLGSTPVFAGDDLTDQPAMALCAERGGDGIWIGPNAPEYAGLRFANPAAMLTHLEDWIAP